MKRSARIAVCMAALALILASCQGLKLQRPIAVTESDWPTFARSIDRTAVAAGSISPPLKSIWEADLTGGVGSGSPVVVDSFLFVGNLRGELYAININTGKRVGWSNLGEAIKGSPVIAGIIAYVATSNNTESLLAYDLVDGKIRWRAAYGDIEVSPLMAFRYLYVGNTAGVFFCVDRDNGNEVWRFRLPDNRTRKGIRSSPATDGRFVFFGADDGHIYALEGESGKQVWRSPVGSPVMAGPAVHDGMLFATTVNGEIHAFATEDGTPQWQHATGASIYATPTIAGELVVTGTTAGTVVALNRRTGEIAWQTDAGGVVSASGATSGNTVYIGTLKKELLALDALTGGIRERHTVRGRVKSAPAIAHGSVFVATDERLVLAFRGITQ